jgi:hypothetical protein
MTNKSALSGAHAAFAASDLRHNAFKDQVEKERIATDAKTARLKALRLAKEAEAPPPSPKKKR